MEIKINSEDESLTISVTKEETEDWSDELIHDDVQFLNSILEDRWCNGEYYVFSGDQLGHMTEAPIIAESATLNDDGSWIEHGRIWWFPDYCVENCMETLKSTGSVTFNIAYVNK